MMRAPTQGSSSSTPTSTSTCRSDEDGSLDWRRSRRTGGRRVPGRREPCAISCSRWPRLKNTPNGKQAGARWPALHHVAPAGVCSGFEGFQRQRRGPASRSAGAPPQRRVSMSRPLTTDVAVLRRTRSLRNNHLAVSWKDAAPGETGSPLGARARRSPMRPVPDAGSEPREHDLRGFPGDLHRTLPGPTTCWVRAPSCGLTARSARIPASRLRFTVRSVPRRCSSRRTPASARRRSTSSTMTR